MMFFRTTTTMLAALALIAALAGCVAGPRLPLMSPLDAGAGYGYSHDRLADDRFEVSYLGRDMRTSLNKSKRDVDAETARDLAYDLALWRAAELATQNDYPAFTVESAKSDLEVEIVDDGPYFGHFGYFYADRFYHPGFYSPHAYGGVFRSAWLQARATLTVVMHAAMREGAHEAAATAERLQAKHPDALTLPQ